MEDMILPSGGEMTLADLTPGEAADVLCLEGGWGEINRRRMLNLGLTPGTRVWVVWPNLFGDPRAYRVRGTLIALRREQAARVRVRPLAEAAENP